MVGWHVVSMRLKLSRSCRRSKRIHHLPLLFVGTRCPPTSWNLSLRWGAKEVTVGLWEFPGLKIDENWAEYKDVPWIPEYNPSKDKHVGPIWSKLYKVNSLPVFNLYFLHPSFLTAFFGFFCTQTLCQGVSSCGLQSNIPGRVHQQPSLKATRPTTQKWHLPKHLPYFGGGGQFRSFGWCSN